MRKCVQVENSRLGLLPVEVFVGGALAKAAAVSHALL